MRKKTPVASGKRHVDLNYNAPKKSRSASSSEASLSPRYWIFVVLISFIASLTVQLGFSFFHGILINYSVCFNPIIPEHTKKYFECVGFRRKDLAIDDQRISYFYEPSPVEPWIDIDEKGKQKPLTSEVNLFRLVEETAVEVNPATQAEALAALQAAKRSREGGHNQKAEVIIEHAYALAPHHPDILTEYGIFMETVRNDVLEADTMYHKALHVNPRHTEALTRRQKTLPLVEEIDNKMLREIHKKRDLFLSIPRYCPTLKRAMRESYFQHIYHTIALEGNTFTLGETRAMLESRQVIPGKSLIEHNEILGMDAALRYLNSSLKTVKTIEVNDILAIHKRVLGFVDPIAAGTFRETQVYITDFVPAPPEYVEHDMNEFIDWLNDDETLRIDPVELAALVHYKLVFIHPFIDGNGRTARLLMNFILMQAGYPPVIIPVEQRRLYFSTLKLANDGDLRPFIRFIARMTNSSLDYYMSAYQVGDIREYSETIIPASGSLHADLQSHIIDP